MEKLEAQRARSNIDKELLADYILGNNQQRKNLEHINDTKKQRGIFRDPRVFEMSRSEVIDYSIKRSVEAVQRPFTFPNGEELNLNNFIHEEFSNDNVLFAGGVGLLMTQKMVEILGTDEQKDLWLEKIFNHTLKCCYAQTEIAHGTDVQNLQTLATFDPETQEFILHTPSIEAMKWWPGDLGLFSTHALVFARLISKGTDHGV